MALAPLLRLHGQEERNPPVTAEDIRILQRARELLPDEMSWNRHDDRNCPAEAKTLSLFCALNKSSIEVLGAYDHRRAALQEVRFAIEEVSGGREFEHRLRDFNNLSETTLGDIHRVLEGAASRVQARLQAGAGTASGRISVPQRIGGESPSYPASVRRRGIEGRVLLEYTISANGRAKNVAVVVAEPKGVFDKASLATIRTWRFSVPDGWAEADAARVFRQGIVFDLEPCDLGILPGVATWTVCMSPVAHR